MQIIKSKGLCFFSLFKVLLIGLFLPVFFLGTACGISALLGHDTVSINHAYVHGVNGLIAGMVIGLLVPVLLSLLLSIIMVPGTWIMMKCCSITLKIKE